MATRSAQAVLVGLLAVLASGCSSEAPTPRNLLLVSLDTTRPDHLSAYGYERQTSPRFDQLATGGALFTNAFAQWTATGPSHASMLTGFYPHTHSFGVTRPRLRKRFPTLATILKREGFRTGAFVSGFPLKGRLATGLERDFDVYDAEFQGVRRDGELTVSATLDWLQSGDAEQPYFAFVHLYDAHGPYARHGGIERIYHSADRGPELPLIPFPQVLRDADGTKYTHLNDYVDHYDSGLTYQDSVLGELVDAIDLDRTLLIVTADHGESMGEHGEAIDLTHSTAVFDDQTRIPFLIRSPGIAPARFDELIETVDILPTALELLGVAELDHLKPQGETLVPLLRGERAQSAGGMASSGTWAKPKQALAVRQIFELNGVPDLDPKRVVFAARTQRWKLTVFPGDRWDFEALYDLEADPLERINVSADNPEIHQRLRERSTAWITGATEEIEELELTNDEVEKLRTLGYVD